MYWENLEKLSEFKLTLIYIVIYNIYYIIMFNILIVFTLLLHTAS